MVKVYLILFVNLKWLILSLLWFSIAKIEKIWITLYVLSVIIVIVLDGTTEQIRSLQRIMVRYNVWKSKKQALLLQTHGDICMNIVVDATLLRQERRLGLKNKLFFVFMFSALAS